MTCRILNTSQAQRDTKEMTRSQLQKRAQHPPDILAADPYQSPPRYEKLVGDLEVAFTRRINIQHRLVYQILGVQRAVKDLRLWTHCG